MYLESPNPSHKFLGKGFRVTWLCSAVTRGDGSHNVNKVYKSTSHDLMDGVEGNSFKQKKQQQ